MKLFDKVEPIYFIDDEMNKLLNDIDNNIIKRVGSDKTGYWEVLK